MFEEFRQVGTRTAKREGMGWPSAAREASRDVFHRLACCRGDGRFAVEQSAPKTIGVAARFGTAGEVAIQGHAAVVRAVAAWRVLLAITYIEDLEGRIGKRLTAGAPRAGNDRTIGKVLAHDRDPHGTRRRCPSAVSLAAPPIHTEGNRHPGARAFSAMLMCAVGVLARSPVGVEYDPDERVKKFESRVPVAELVARGD